MKTELQKQLATIAPSISIRTIWELEQSPGMSIFSEDWTLHGENPDNWQAWQSEIRATVILDGEEVHGSAYLGGAWEKAGDLPEVSNPEISGYENQMTVEALEELQGLIFDTVTLDQISAAIAHCKEQARISYEKQRAELAAA